MEIEYEIKEVFELLKSQIRMHRDIGMDPPFLSPEGLRAFKYNPDVEKPSISHSMAEDPALSLESLRTTIGDCQRCKLSKKRTHIVFGEGSPLARLVFVGEAPGREEDVAGRPFVGEAGKLLTRIIQNGIGLNREDVYICNVIKCRPPNNRDPEQDEIETCIPFLKEQIRIIRPEVICVLVRVAGRSLLGGDFKITNERGRWHSYKDIPLMPTYHPAYIVRNPSQENRLKRDVWEDVKKIMKVLGLEVKRNV